MNRKLVYNSIVTAIGTYDNTIYCSQTMELVPPSIPAVFIQQISKIRTEQFATLCNTDEQSYDTYEVQVFAVTLNGAYDIMEVVESAFKSLGFFEIMCHPTNNIDKNIQRIVARFSAQQGAD